MTHGERSVWAKDIIDNINQADAAQICEICAVVMQRYKVLFPDSEILFLNLPKYDIIERERLLSQIITWLKVETFEKPK